MRYVINKLYDIHCLYIYIYRFNIQMYIYTTYTIV